MMGGAAEFSEMLAFVQKKGLKPVVDQSLALKDGKAAYRILEEGKQFGKVVLCP